MFDHFLVEGMLRVGMMWGETRRVGEAKKVLNVNEFNKKEEMVEYEERITDKWNVVNQSHSKLGYIFHSLHSNHSYCYVVSYVYKQ